MTAAPGLDRFVAAQARVWPAPLDELRRGRKTTHWMWFVFPQLRGLGRSDLAIRYGIADAAEAARYLAHPSLGQRLAECAGALLPHGDRPPEAILGDVDALKLRSSMTLFAPLPGADPAFAAVLARFYGGARCRHTAGLLGG
ncbi:MAG: DUF1810 domain-containing protein [Paracoccaceae bacterium]|nr:MAG: DUF1810 domain-containing protein [Paracoccaceae bacterium]